MSADLKRVIRRVRQACPDRFVQVVEQTSTADDSKVNTTSRKVVAMPISPQRRHALSWQRERF